MYTDALIKAIEIVGTQSELARRCGIKQQNVYNWLHRNKRVSVQHVLKVEAATNGLVTRHELRPDIYPNETVPNAL